MLLSVLALTLLSQSGLTSATVYQFNFDTDMDGMTVHRAKWHWSDRANVGWKVPAGSDGFAIYSTPGEGDEFYSQQIPVENGLNYTITYFLASEWPESTTLQLQKLAKNGDFIELIDDYYRESDPYNTKWFTKTGYVPPGQPSLVSKIQLIMYIVL